MREELKPLPKRMLGLPVDKRGYPVPWFVPLVSGEPEFRAQDSFKWVRAIKEKLCWVCGEPLGRFKTFVAGPMCGVNRTSSEPPGHLECARWSACNCPFLTQRQMKRREDEFSKSCPVSGESIRRNPGVALLWTTLSYRPFKVPTEHDDGSRGWLIEMGEPTSLEFYSHGRVATRAEIEESIRTGLPFLMGMALEQDRDEPGAGAVAHLHKLCTIFQALLPPA